MDVFFGTSTAQVPLVGAAEAVAPDPDALSAAARVLAGAERPVLVLGGDVWTGRAEEAARRLAEELQIPVVPNGQGRGVVPSSSPLSVSGARSAAFGRADVVVVVGTPLDFRLGYGVFGGKEGAPPAQVVHVADSPAGVSSHATLAAGVSGDLALVLTGLLEEVGRLGPRDTSAWREDLTQRSAAQAAKDAELRGAGGDKVHPVRVYGELEQVLEPDAVVIGDGGDFVSYAGKHVPSEQPGCWMDPGPYGCLGTGLGYAMAARIARPSSQVCLLLGDGAAGFSLMDVDTLVRHDLPVVMVVGNNSMWGLEKAPMQLLYGYDVAADLRPGTRYDQVVTALGGGGELVERPEDLSAALRRAFDSGVPLLRQRPHRSRRRLPASDHRRLSPLLGEEVLGYELGSPHGQLGDDGVQLTAPALRRVGVALALGEAEQRPERHELVPDGGDAGPGRHPLPVAPEGGDEERAGTVGITLSLGDGGDTLAADRQVPLPPAVRRVRPRQPLRDLQPRREMTLRRRQVPPRHRHLPQPFPAERQVPLPPAVRRVRPRQPLRDVQPGREVTLRRNQVPPRHRHVPQPVAADRQVPAATRCSTGPPPPTAARCPARPRSDPPPQSGPPAPPQRPPACCG